VISFLILNLFYFVHVLDLLSRYFSLHCKCSDRKTIMCMDYRVFAKWQLSHFSFFVFPLSWRVGNGCFSASLIFHVERIAKPAEMHGLYELQCSIQFSSGQLSWVQSVRCERITWVYMKQLQTGNYRPSASGVQYNMAAVWTLGNLGYVKKIKQ